MHTNEKKQQHNVYHHTAIYQNTQLYAICSRVYFIYQGITTHMFLEYYVNETFFEFSSLSSKLPYHITAIYQNTQLYAICSRVYFIYQALYMFFEFYVNETFCESSSSSLILPYHIQWLPVAMMLCLPCTSL